MNPNSIANLQPAWTSETAPRNGGKTRSGMLSIREEFNRLIHHGVVEDELRQIRDNKRIAPNRRVAADAVLQMLERVDMADLEDFIEGRCELKDLRAKGINTEAIRDYDKTEVVSSSENGTTTRTHRSVKLHDRVGTMIDRAGEFEQRDRLADGLPTSNLSAKVTGQVDVRHSLGHAEGAIAALEAAGVPEDQWRQMFPALADYRDRVKTVEVQVVEKDQNSVQPEEKKD